MNETIHQDERYPEWMKAWNAKTTEIDQEIMDYFEYTAKTTAEALEEISHKIQAWWDRQHMTAEAKAEYEQAKSSDREAVRERVERRIEYLEREGRLNRREHAAEVKNMQAGGDS